MKFNIGDRVRITKVVEGLPPESVGMEFICFQLDPPIGALSTWHAEKYEAELVQPAFKKPSYFDMLTLMKHVAKRHNLCPDCLGIGAKTAIYDRDGEDGHVNSYRSNCRTCGMSGKAKS